MRSATWRWLGVVAIVVIAAAGTAGAAYRMRQQRAANASPSAGAAVSGSAGNVDLALRSVGVRGDRLVVLVANEGAADVDGHIVVSVDGAPPVRIDQGKPLRPGEAIEAVLTDEVVQRRAMVTVVASMPEVTEPLTENNRLMLVVAPDVPIDLELESAAVDAGTGHLVLAVRNRGPVPLTGTLVLSVRERPPSNRLVSDGQTSLDVGAGGVQTVDLATAARVDLARAVVTMSTDAIADADPANDVWPR